MMHSCVRWYTFLRRHGLLSDFNTRCIQMLLDSLVNLVCRLASESICQLLARPHVDQRLARISQRRGLKTHAYDVLCSGLW